LSRFLTVVAGRRAKWVVLLVWLAAIFATGAAGLLEKFDDAQENESSSFLPGDAESTEALKAAEALQDGELAPLVVVFRREDGLTAEDRKAIDGIRSDLNSERTLATSEYEPAAISPDGSGALLVAQVTSDGESDTILDPVDMARETIEEVPEGLEAAVTGGAGFSADAIDVFESIDSTLLLATAGLVFILLLVVYRSPIFWFFPLVAVAFAEVASRAAGYGLTEIGVTVNGQSAGILPVLVFGAGTDYALLLVARYREELRQHEDKHEAMAVALRRAGPAIVASGLTVVAALLCLTLADVQGTAGLGPIGSVGIAIAMLSMLTILPALLVATGRWTFWPLVPHVGDEAADETHGIWSRIGDRIAKRPRTVWAATILLLLVMSAGWVKFDTGLTQGNQFRGDVDAVKGQELVEASFPAGSTAPTDVIVRDESKVEAVVATLEESEDVESVREAAQGEQGVLLQATLVEDPFSTEAFDVIEPLRAAVKNAGGEDTIVGGSTAIERDLRVAAERDTKLIPPIALAVVFLILIALLRSVVAPLILIGTVIVSFVAALGVGFVVFDLIFDFPGADPSLPLFVFIFLVALGVDYNIFLMARVREETLEHGTRAGTLRGLAVTGGVITSAGIVLAGTFSTLAVLPLIFLTELGFVVAFGVLLDTFLVRSILVPAIVLDVGPKTWWPSRLAREDGAPATDAAKP